MGLALFSVALQMNEVRGGFLTNYLADLAGPVWLYGTLRLDKTILRFIVPWTRSPLFAALFVFSVGTAWEVCQAFDFKGTVLNITHGRFDPLDIAAFALGASISFFVDKIVLRRAKKTALSSV